MRGKLKEWEFLQHRNKIMIESPTSLSSKEEIKMHTLVEH